MCVLVSQHVHGLVEQARGTVARRRARLLRVDAGPPRRRRLTGELFDGPRLAEVSRLLLPEAEVTVTLAPGSARLPATAEELILLFVHHLLQTWPGPRPVAVRLGLDHQAGAVSLSGVLECATACVLPDPEAVDVLRGHGGEVLLEHRDALASAVQATLPTAG